MRSAKTASATPTILLVALSLGPPRRTVMPTARMTRVLRAVIVVVIPVPARQITFEITAYPARGALRVSLARAQVVTRSKTAGRAVIRLRRVRVARVARRARRARVTQLVVTAREIEHIIATAA